MKIRLLLTVILAAISLGVHAQQGSLSGKVISRGDRQPVEGARVTVDYGQKAVKTTDKNGVFTFENIPYGVWRVTVSFPDYVTYELDVNINSASRTLGNISLVKAMTPGNMFGDMLPELDNGTDEDQSMPVSLSASDDVYSRIANYEFSEMRLKNRGFDSGKEDVYLNGVLMNDASTGYGPWSLLSGLNAQPGEHRGASGFGLRRGRCERRDADKCARFGHPQGVQGQRGACQRAVCHAYHGYLLYRYDGQRMGLCCQCVDAPGR